MASVQMSNTHLMIEIQPVDIVRPSNLITPIVTTRSQRIFRGSIQLYEGGNHVHVPLQSHQMIVVRVFLRRIQHQLLSTVVPVWYCSVVQYLLRVATGSADAATALQEPTRKSNIIDLFIAVHFADQSLVVYWLREIEVMLQIVHVLDTRPMSFDEVHRLHDRASDVQVLQTRHDIYSRITHVEMVEPVRVFFQHINFILHCLRFSVKVGESKIINCDHCGACNTYHIIRRAKPLKFQITRAIYRKDSPIGAVSDKPISCFVEFNTVSIMYVDG